MPLVRSLSAIDADSVVLIDSSVLVYGMTGTVGTALAPSEQAFNLLTRCTLGVVFGVLTHQIVTAFAKEMTAIALSNAGHSAEAAIERAMHDGHVEKTQFFDPFPRLETLLRSSLRLLAPQNTDFLSAFEKAQRADVKLEVALTLACFERVYGPHCVVATATSAYDSLQEPEITVFKATDIANLPAV